MKRRPETTTSERELIDALAAGGRSLSLDKLASWRKHGLLPPLASQGTGSGRAYYWREPDIRQRARAAFDLMQRHCQVDQALWGLWLRGFPVPAVKLRRAWRHCSRIRKPWLPIALSEKDKGSAVGGPGTLLLQATRVLGRALPPDRRIAAIIEHAVARLGRANGRFDGTSGSQLWSLLQMAGLALESSALLDHADDAQLTRTQHYLRLAARLLEESSSDLEAWNDWLADRVGPPLALAVLALLRSGQVEALDNLAAQAEAPGRRRVPARASPYQVTA